MKIGLVGVMSACLLSLAGPAVAQLQPAPQIGPRSRAQVRASDLSTSSIEAELAGNHPRALELADAAIRANSLDAWGYYLRGNALLSLRHIDDAVTSFQDAEQRFPAADPWGKSVAIWGQANALSEAGRCRDADPIYERYAAFVALLDSAAASLAREHSKKQCDPPAVAPFTQLEIDSSGFQIGGNHQRSLELADEAIRLNPDRAWGYYLRADALASLRRFDEAVASFRDAEQRFHDADAWGKSIAIWGQANALKEAGRCQEAAPIYERYAAFVEQRDPVAAAMGRKYSKKQCTPPVTRN